VIPVAKAFPETKIVIAHCGMILGGGEALIAASLCPNAYLETSWTVPHHILTYIEKIGAQRVMYASDEYLNVPAELAKYYNLPITKEQLEQCLGKTAISAFGLTL
jgi:predicted TIM-barrel fold metal-dependent hydrolase